MILPTHNCRNEISAIQIKKIEYDKNVTSETEESATLFTDKGKIRVNRKYVRTWSPHVGGYYVQDKGNELFVNREMFELFCN